MIRRDELLLEERLLRRLLDDEGLLRELPDDEGLLPELPLMPDDELAGDGPLDELCPELALGEELLEGGGGGGTLLLEEEKLLPGSRTIKL